MEDSEIERKESNHIEFEADVFIHVYVIYLFPSGELDYPRIVMSSPSSPLWEFRETVAKLIHEPKDNLGFFLEDPSNPLTQEEEMLKDLGIHHLSKVYVRNLHDDFQPYLYAFS